MKFFRSFWLRVRPLIHYLSNAMYGCLTQLSYNMAIDAFFSKLMTIFAYYQYANVCFHIGAIRQGEKY